MELLIKIKNYILYVLEKGSLGLTIYEIFTVIVLFFFAVAIRAYFAKFIINKIKNYIKKTDNKIDDTIFNSISKPLETLPIITVFILFGFFIKTDTHLSQFIDKINKTFVTIFIFWLLHQSLIPLSIVFKHIEQLISKALVLWMIRSLRYLLIFLGIVAVLETWGIKIGPVIAGLGLFGVAVALGAQDLFKNLISGIMIILERRFELNDVIEVTGHAIGTVEHIGFRSTLIRRFDSTPISIPNYVFSDISIVNFSDRKYRRINWIIGLTYSTSTKQLKNICHEIQTFIRSNSDFIKNDIYELHVRVEKFNDSSIDVLIYTFTNTNKWDQCLKIKEQLIYQIKEIVEKNGSSFAFPSKSIYIEKN